MSPEPIFESELIEAEMTETDLVEREGAEPTANLGLDEIEVEVGPVSETEPEPIDETQPVGKAEPVKPTERVTAVDTMRGVALLGILAMNINNFGWPGRVYSDPMGDPGAGALDIGLWAFNHIFFDTKMMTTFSMLFGAGLVLMSDRADGKGARLIGTYYRRIFWLIVIGCIHAYLIWDGDILVMYGEAGLLLYPFRHRSPKLLLIVGTILCMLILPLLAGFLEAKKYAERTSAEMKGELNQGPPASRFRYWVHNKWLSARESMGIRSEDFKKDVETYRGGYVGIVKERAWHLLMSHTFGFIFGFWYVGGRMLIGMGLMKLGVFSAQRSPSFYRKMMLFGYGFGLPLVIIDCIQLYINDWYLGRGLDAVLNGTMLLGVFSGIPIALGHIGVVMRIIQSGSLRWLTDRLASAGRMALSNYLFDSILCTTLMYGYGFGYYATVSRSGLYLLVLTIWAFQLWFSPIWLGRFRYGPAEWLWRSLTYWKFQPMRRELTTPSVAAA